MRPTHRPLSCRDDGPLVQQRDLRDDVRRGEPPALVPRHARGPDDLRWGGQEEVGNIDQGGHASRSSLLA